MLTINHKFKKIKLADIQKNHSEDHMLCLREWATLCNVLCQMLSRENRNFQTIFIHDQVFGAQKEQFLIVLTNSYQETILQICYHIYNYKYSSYDSPKILLNSPIVSEQL